MTDEVLLLSYPADGVALVTLNRPAHGNAVVPELVSAFLQSLDAIDANRDIRVLVVTGAGKQFCAGADLKEFQAYLNEQLRANEEPYNARILHPLTERLAALRVPTIAAVNGAATAGGLDLALACDMRIGGRSARFGETYIKLGLAPGNGGAYFLPRLIGSGMAAQLAFTGDLIDAGRALDIGLINEVVDDQALMDHVCALATRIAKNPRKALEATKHLLRTSWHTDLRGSLSTSYWMTSTLQYSRDVGEGVDAAIEKRTPQYNKTRASNAKKQ